LLPHLPIHLHIVCFQQCLQSITFLPFSHISTTKVFKNNGKSKKWRIYQPWTLTYTLVFQTMSFPLSSFFCFGPIGFPSKMMPCKLNHNFICLGFGPLSKGLGTNLKLLTNRNV
jgi:hypothetical protein